MSKSSVTFLCLLLAAPLAAKYLPRPLSEIYQYVGGERHEMVRVSAGGPAFDCLLVGNTAQNLLQRVDITPSGASKVTQTILPDMKRPPPRGVPYFQAVDVNFDGFKDLLILVDWDPAGNTYKSAWLYDRKSALFEPAPQLDGLPGLEVDASARHLRSFSRGPEAFVGRTHVWRRGRLEAVSEERQEFDLERDRVRVTRREKKRGAWVVVVQEDRPMDDSPGAP